MNDLGELYRQHYGYVFKLCRRMLDSKEDAEDMAQTVFAHIASVPEGKTEPRYAQFRGQAKFTTWLHRVAYNCCLGELRRRRRQPPLVSLDLPIPGEEDDALRLEKPAKNRDPYLRVVLLEALERLPEGYRAVLILRYAEGLSNEEAGRVLGYTEGCSKSQSFRGLAHLRELLG